MAIGGKQGLKGLRAVCLLTAVMLAGCFDDGSSTSPKGLATANPTSSAATGANRAPTISGTAGTSVVADGTYNFTPAASDADGNTLSFTIQNKPAWATFNTLTGRLTGTPGIADIGSYANILISVSDGTANAALSAFSIAVTQIGTGTATLSWLPPTENVDGTPLLNLAGYRIYYGQDAATLNQSVTIDNASINRYVIENLTSDTWYFSIKAYTATGVESDYSAVASKSIS